MKRLPLLILLLGCASLVGATPPEKSSLFRAVSLKSVPLKSGERIASIEVTVALGYFRRLEIPFDWSFDVGTPISCVSVLKGAAGHGSSMPFTTEEFRQFVVLEFPSADDLAQSSVGVKLGLYLYDPKTNGEEQRTIELPPECIVLTEPNKPLQGTPAKARSSSTEPETQRP